jgi:hypothetical protein|tara:strand:- start:10798 stop:10911 length:114 start_codon:yes stop_codon:yes gene_type:complete
MLYIYVYGVEFSRLKRKTEIVRREKKVSKRGAGESGE